MLCSGLTSIHQKWLNIRSSSSFHLNLDGIYWVPVVSISFSRISFSPLLFLTSFRCCYIRPSYRSTQELEMIFLFEFIRIDKKKIDLWTPVDLTDDHNFCLFPVHFQHFHSDFFWLILDLLVNRKYLSVQLWVRFAFMLLHMISWSALVPHHFT